MSRFGYAPLVPALIGAGWFDPGAAGYLGATNLAGYIAGAGLARRMSLFAAPRALMQASLAIATAGFIACAYPLGFWWYFGWRFASGVIGGVLMVLAAPAVLAIAPPALRGRIAGTVFTGVGTGIALSGTLVPWALRFGLPATWWSLAIASALLGAFAWVALPRGAPVRETAAPAVATSARLTPAIALVALAYAASAIGFVPHTVYWVDFVARGLGRGVAAGGHQWVLLGVAAACGPLLAGLVADRIGFVRTFRWALLLQAVALILPIASTGGFALALSSIGTGALGIGSVSLASGRVAELVPLEHQRQVWGWLTLAFSIAYAGMGYALAFVFARTGSYAILFAIAAAALVAGAVIDMLAPRPA